jgi:endonuclease G
MDIDTTLTTTVEHVEKAAGLVLFNEELKSKSRQLCAVARCQLVIRRFDDARKDFKVKGQDHK